MIILVIVLILMSSGGTGSYPVSVCDICLSHSHIIMCYKGVSDLSVASCLGENVRKILVKKSVQFECME